MRVGIGFDVHKLTSGRPLILGGVEIPHALGLSGHSDADVVLHAIMDAMLGAISAGDIGSHFPDTCEKYKDISSLKLLTETNDIVKDKGFKLVNLDVTVMLEEPKIHPFRAKIEESISKALELERERVSVKATTTEGLGFTGRGEGIAAQAIVLVEEG